MPHIIKEIQTTGWVLGKGHVSYVIEKRLPLEMLNARYGIVKTEDKAARAINGALEYHYEQIKDGPLHHSDMWDMYHISVFRNTERYEFLYDVIDTEYGYTLARMLKHMCKPFVAMLIKDQFTLTRQYMHEKKQHAEYRSMRPGTVSLIVGRKTYRVVTP